MTKKFIMIFCTLLMILGLVGCGNKTKPDDKTDSSKETIIESESETISESETTEDEKVIYEDDYIKVFCWGELIIETKTDSTYEWSSLEDIAEFKLKENKYVFSPLKEGNLTFDFLSEDISYEIELYVYSDMTIFASIRELSEVTNENEPIDIEDKDIEEKFNSIYDAIPDEIMPPSLMTTSIDINNTDTMLYNFGVEKLEGLEVAYISEPMIMPNAYSLSILRFSDNDKASEAENILKESAPINKWICVSAEDLESKAVDNYVIFVMAPNDIVEIIRDIVVE